MKTQIKAQIKDILRSNLPHLFIATVVATGTWFLVSEHDANFYGSRVPADVATSSPSPEASGTGDSATDRLNRIKDQIAKNRSQINDNRKAVGDRARSATQKARNKIGSQIDNAQDSATQRLDRIQQQLRDRRGVASDQLNSRRDDVVAKARGQLQSAKDWAAQTRSDLQPRIADARTQTRDAIQNGRANLQDRLEQIKQTIRDKHADLNARNPRITTYRTENMLYLTFGDNLDQLAVNLDTYEITSGKNFVESLPLSASVTIMGFHDFLNDLISSLHDRAKDNIHSELASTSEERDELDRTVDQLTNIRARVIVDRLGVAAKEKFFKPAATASDSPSSSTSVPVSTQSH